MVALFVTVAEPRPRSWPTLALPSGMAPTTLLLSLLRNRLELDAGAVPGAGERFLTTWVTLTLPLALLAAGVNVTDVTVRSGRTTLRITVDRNVLFVSSASATALAGSAMKRSL